MLKELSIGNSLLPVWQLQIGVNLGAFRSRHVTVLDCGKNDRNLMERKWRKPPVAPGNFVMGTKNCLCRPMMSSYCSRKNALHEFKLNDLEPSSSHFRGTGFIQYIDELRNNESGYRDRLPRVATGQIISLTAYIRHPLTPKIGIPNHFRTRTTVTGVALRTTRRGTRSSLDNSMRAHSSATRVK